jgi:hypothetical protein
MALGRAAETACRTSGPPCGVELVGEPPLHCGREIKDGTLKSSEEVRLSCLWIPLARSPSAPHLSDPRSVRTSLCCYFIGSSCGASTDPQDVVISRQQPPADRQPRGRSFGGSVCCVQNGSAITHCSRLGQAGAGEETQTVINNNRGCGEGDNSYHLPIVPRNFSLVLEGNQTMVIARHLFGPPV